MSLAMNNDQNGYARLAVTVICFKRPYFDLHLKSSGFRDKTCFYIKIQKSSWVGHFRFRFCVKSVGTRVMANITVCFAVMAARVFLNVAFANASPILAYVSYFYWSCPPPAAE